MKKNIVTIMLILFVFFNVKAQFVQPTFEDGKYKLLVKDIYFEIDPEFGARITSYMLGNEEIVMPESFGVIMGSTFWPSPQSIWGWPPPPPLNEHSYTGGIINKKIWLTSEADPFTNLGFSKTAFANLADTSITINYTMINHSNEAQTYAPWEVTRVPSKGLIFFPTGEGEVFGNMAGNTETIDDYIWFNPTDPNGNKFFSDSKGWLAYVNENRFLFIKLFEDIPANKAAPDEAEIEIYVGGDVMELENQGAYTEIPSNDSVVWGVKWFVDKLPDHIVVENGNQDLIDFALNIINRSSPNPEPEVSIINKAKPQLKLYPNPATEKIYTSYSLIEGKKFKIYNTNGQLVQQGEINNQIINISVLKKGFYALHIGLGNNSYRSNFIKK